jgi:hypothetical protein
MKELPRNPVGGMDVSYECYVCQEYLTYDGLIPNPEESY